MNKSLLLILLLAVCRLSFAAEPAAPPPDATFFTKLRMDYAKRKDFSPAWKFDKDREAVIDAYRAKEHKTVVALAERWLAKCPVDADIHTLCSGAAAALGDLRKCVHHSYFAFGLMQSLMQSGDGLTPKTAFKVISVAEEYSVLGEINAEVTEQSLLQGSIDQMNCQLPDGKKLTLYFDASIPMKAMAGELKPK